MINFFKKKNLKKYKNYFTKDCLRNDIDADLAEIGDWTYGNPKIMRWDTKDKLRIGKYSSIGPEVTIIFGGNHRQDWVTTSPIPAETFQAYKKFDEAKDIKDFIYSNGDIVIGNDVWIGAKSLILSGSKIGDGAVIGAGSVVRGEIEPYTISTGNPIVTTGKRFSEEIIQKLLKIKWWNLQDEKVNKFSKLLCSNKIEEFIKKVTSN